MSKTKEKHYQWNEGNYQTRRDLRKAKHFFNQKKQKYEKQFQEQWYLDQDLEDDLHWS